MKVNKEIFKAYDIRGIYPDEISDEVAFNIARAFARMIQKEQNKQDIKILVSRDMRECSVNLIKKVEEGLVEEGVEVLEAGLNSTPTFYFAVGKHEADAGIQVTASHNPKEYGGLKLVREKGKPVSGYSGIEDIRDEVSKGVEDRKTEKGRVVKVEDPTSYCMDYYIKLSGINIEKLKPMKVVVDAASGMGADDFDVLTKKIPAIKFVKMNFELDGSFPAHEADPSKPENLVDLIKKCKEEKADFGIGLDGDGDRIFIIDDSFQTVEPQILRGLFAQIFLREHPGAHACYDVRCGKITEEMIKEAGGIPVLTKVGHSFIKEEMLKHNAIYAGESSGHFYYNSDFGAFDAPILMVLKLIKELNDTGKRVSEIINPYRKYSSSGEINSLVGDPQGKIAELKEKYKDGEQSELDGISVDMGDWWLNVRASNTEPKLRLNLEAVSKELMEEKRDEVLNLIRS